MKILLGVTGSVAAILTPKLIEELLAMGSEIKVVATEKSFYFLNPDRINRNAGPVYMDKDEWWSERYIRGTNILHISLRDWADVLLIAPLSANSLAKLANGLADNFLTSIARAWPVNKPIILAPAMNTEMWNHPITAEHIERLKKWFPKLRIINPISKVLACGTEGIGAMAEIDSIVKEVRECAP